MVFSQIVNAADIRMSNAASNLDFLVKAIEERWVASKFRRDYFDCDVLT